MCCACRAVQRGQTPLEAARDARPKVVRAHVRCPWVKRFLKYIYSPCLTALLVYLLICQDVYPGHRGDFTCFPCRCSAGRLQSCSLAAQLQQEQLVIAGVTSIEPQAFKPLGCRLSRLSLANNSITSLKPRSFEHLPCLQILDISRSKLSMLARDSFYGLDQLEVLSLHGNELHNISGDHLSHLPSLEKLLLGSKSGWDNETLTTYELEAGNLIRFLPPRLFEGNPHLNFFDISGNNMTKVDRDTFVGATNLQVLDLRQNSLRELPEGLCAFSMLSIFRHIKNDAVLTSLNYFGKKCMCTSRRTLCWSLESAECLAGQQPAQCTSRRTLCWSLEAPRSLAAQQQPQCTSRTTLC